MSELAMSPRSGSAATAVPDPPGAVAAKRLAAAFSLLMLLVVLSPIIQNWRAEPRDDFPLSYFPMFTYLRSDTFRLSYLVGVDAHGNRRKIPYTYAGSGGMNQVRRQMNKLIGEGRSGELCRSVSSQVARRRGSSLERVVSVQVVTGTYHLSDYFGGNKAPAAERINASCAVAR